MKHISNTRKISLLLGFLLITNVFSYISGRGSDDEHNRLTLEGYQKIVDDHETHVIELHKEKMYLVHVIETVTGSRLDLHDSNGDPLIIDADYAQYIIDEILFSTAKCNLGVDDSLKMCDDFDKSLRAMENKYDITIRNTRR